MRYPSTLVYRFNSVGGFESEDSEPVEVVKVFDCNDHEEVMYCTEDGSIHLGVLSGRNYYHADSKELAAFSVSYPG